MVVQFTSRQSSVNKFPAIPAGNWFDDYSGASIPPAIPAGNRFDDCSGASIPPAITSLARIGLLLQTVIKGRVFVVLVLFILHIAGDFCLAPS